MLKITSFRLIMDISLYSISWSYHISKSHVVRQYVNIQPQKQSSAYRRQTQRLIERWNRTMVQMLRQYVATTRRIRASTWTSSWLHTEPVAIRQLSLLLFNLSMNVKINYQLSCWPLTLDQLTMMEKQGMWKASDKILGRCMKPIEEQVLPKSCNMTSTSTLQTCNLERKCFWRDQLQDQDWPPKLTPKYRRPYTLTCILGKDELNGQPPLDVEGQCGFTWTTWREPAPAN